MALLKAAILVEGGIVTIPCYYNPDELKISRSNEWHAPNKSGGGVPKLQYKRANAAKTNLSLKFDTTAEGTPVTVYTNMLFALMEPNPLLPGSNPLTGNIRPPKVTFRWGMMATYESVIEDLSVTLTYFSEIGVPLRADVEMSLKQYKDELLLTNPTSGTPRPHKVHTVQPGETLDRIAARYYGDSTKWRLLANANGLEDPLAVQPGRTISIPEPGLS